MNKLIERLERLKKVNPLLRNEWEAGFKDGKESAVETAISIIREMCEAGEVVVPRFKAWQKVTCDNFPNKQVSTKAFVYYGVGYEPSYIISADGLLYQFGEGLLHEAEAQAECERRNKEV